MDDERIRQFVASRDDRLPRPYRRQPGTFLGKTRPCSTVNRTRHAATHLQLRVGGVDDRAEVGLVRNVPLHNLERDTPDRVFDHPVAPSGYP